MAIKTNYPRDINVATGRLFIAFHDTPELAEWIEKHHRSDWQARLIIARRGLRRRGFSRRRWGFRNRHSTT
jgi:hypothetical protein